MTAADAANILMPYGTVVRWPQGKPVASPATVANLMAHGYKATDFAVYEPSPAEVAAVAKMCAGRPLPTYEPFEPKIDPLKAGRRAMRQLGY